jgi:hypothetical protein
MPTPKIPDGVVSPSTRAAVESVYLRFLTRDLAALRRRLPKLKPTLRMQVLAVLGSLESRVMPTILSQTPTEKLATILNGMIEDIATIKAKLANAAPAVDAPSYAGPPTLTGAQLEKILAMIAMITVLAGEVGSGKHDSKIKEIFGEGNVEEAKKNFLKIPDSLTPVAEHPTTMERTRFEEIVALGVALIIPQSRGFVINPGLSEKMPFLTMGSGKMAYIFVQPESLADGTPSPEMISKLVHEGSHVIDSEIVDWFYRVNDVHRALPESFRTKNAAHYEQLALELQHSPASYGVAPPDDLVGRAATLLKFKLTRAWIRSNELRNADPPGGRKLVGELLGAVPAKIGSAAAQELFSDLYDNSENIMNAVVLGTVKLEGPQPYQLVFRDGSTETLIFSEGTPSDLARVALAPLVQRQAKGGATASPVGLLQFVDRIVEYDRPSLQSKSQELCQFLDAEPVP